MQIRRKKGKKERKKRKEKKKEKREKKKGKKGKKEEVFLMNSRGVWGAARPPVLYIEFINPVDLKKVLWYIQKKEKKYNFLSQNISKYLTNISQISQNISK